MAREAAKTTNPLNGGLRPANCAGRLSVGSESGVRVVWCTTPVKHSFSLGNSGRGNHAQNQLKSRPGQRDSGRAAHCEEARTATGNRKSRSQQDGSDSHISA